MSKQTPAIEESWKRMGFGLVEKAMWGSHLCYFFQTKEDLVETTVPYFVMGLTNNECCMWIVSEPLSVEEARGALGVAVGNLDNYFARGQLEIMGYREWYSPGGKFDGGAVLERWVAKEKEALHKGFAGLRVAGIGDQAHHDWTGLITYEAGVDLLISRLRMMALCAYQVDSCEAAELIGLVTNHNIILVQGTSGCESFDNSRRGQVRVLKNMTLSYAEIGRMIGVSRERVRQMASHPRKYHKRPPSLLTVAETARLLNVHTNTIRRWSEKGALHAYRFGSRQDRRFDQKELDDFIHRLGLANSPKKSRAPEYGTR